MPSRGLSFFPKPFKIDRFQIKEDFQQFFRKLPLKEFFYESEGDSEEIPRFRRKSKWTPLCNRYPALETYIKAVKAVQSTLVPEIVYAIISPAKEGRLFLR